MNCYHCETGERPGGMSYGIRPAVGVCRECGIGVCLEHGRREAGGRLLCESCAAKAGLAVVPAPAPGRRREGVGMK